MFDRLVCIRVGDGNKTLFWRDRWINGRAVADFGPAMLGMISTRTRNSRSVKQGLLENRWILDIQGDWPPLLLLQECITLWITIRGVVRDETEELAGVQLW